MKGKDQRGVRSAPGREGFTVQPQIDAFAAPDIPESGTAAAAEGDARTVQLDQTVPPMQPIAAAAIVIRRSKAEEAMTLQQIAMR